MVRKLKLEASEPVYWTENGESLAKVYYKERRATVPFENWLKRYSIEEQIERGWRTFVNPTPRPPGRPTMPVKERRDALVHIKLTDETYEALRKHCYDKNVTRQDAVNDALKIYLINA